MSNQERICSKCGVAKPLTDYSKAPSGRLGLKAHCKACDAERHRRLNPPHPRKQVPLRRGPIDPVAEKRCAACGETKPHFEFSLARAAQPNRNAVYRSNCKQCQATAARGWYARNPERAKANKRRFNLERFYGLTVDQYNELLRKQHGGCAICGLSDLDAPGARRKFELSVDHCHDTGRVRGLLCNRCNRAIGLFGDDPKILHKAIAYLLRGREASHQGGQ